MKKYDYIIIGAGSSGCVLANRLTANGKHTVLLLEAGGKDTKSDISVPAAFYKLYKTDVDYAFHTTPQEHMHNREMFLPRGKVLGGSSSINAMIYIRGNKQDYNEWAALGNHGWSYDEVLPYFKKSENQSVIKNEYHGQGGPLDVQNRNYTNELSHVFVKAGIELGYGENKDFNGAKQAGFGQYQVTHRNGKRCSTAVAYLNPAKSRSNLTIQTKAMVERILIENETATGVVYHQNGQQHQAEANREVLLCAGAYNSRSSYKKSLDSAENFPVIAKHLYQYFLGGKKGPFASNIGEAGAFVKSSPDQPAVDIQYHFGPGYFLEHGFQKPDGNGYSVGGKVLNPSSKGTVKLTSGKYDVAAAIDHNYMSDADDVRRSIWGFRLAQRLGMTKAFEPYRIGGYLPENPLNDDAAIEDFIRATGETLYHPTSTCKMGSDDMAVVSDELKVHGINRLRVVDASVMPNVTRGNTNAPTIMIAEKAADMILEDTKATVENNQLEMA